MMMRFASRFRYAALFAGSWIVLASTAALAQEQSLGSTTSTDGKVKLDIVSLKRSEGDTLTLRFQVTNGGSDTFSVTTSNIRLIDIVGRRIYSPGVTSPTCSTPVQQKFVCYAVFGAPPATTQKINVQFYERVELIGGVPIGE